MDSNHRTRQRTDLQSAAFGHFAKPPWNWCRREDLNPQPTDYKSVALPIELSRHNINYITLFDYLYKMFYPNLDNHLG